MGSTSNASRRTFLTRAAAATTALGAGVLGANPALGAEALGAKPAMGAEALGAKAAGFRFHSR